MKTPQLPFSSLSEALGVPEIWLKREDLHPYGSHKGRSIPLMIKEYKKQGLRKFVISSSGNASLAAKITVEKHNQNNPSDPIELAVFVGEKIPDEKKKLLVSQDPKITLETVTNPKQTAFQMDADGKAKNLRQSTDDSALIGYTELATELEKIPDLSAVFIPTSSGTTAQALGQYFLEKQLSIQIHIVQTPACHPLVDSATGTTANSEETSLAGAIVDKVAHRKEKVVEIIKNTHGSGWIASDAEIQEAQKLVKEHCNISLSANSALAVAGVKKAVQNGWNFSGPVVCLITGR